MIREIELDELEGKTIKSIEDDMGLVLTTSDNERYQIVCWRYPDGTHRSVSIYLLEEGEDFYYY